MARARTLLHQHYQVLALIGDGALGGGLSFEGLNDAGASHEPMIVILNDNGMSIDPNVGGMSRHLSRLRSKPGYYAFKKRYRQVLESSQTGQKLYSVSHDVKTALKKSLLPGSTLFENMGFTYMGPVDGHDVQRLTAVLRAAREAGRPVLVHVHTVKGSGYEPALREPEKFHGSPAARMLREAKDLSRCPVLLHVHTVKGAGYGPAEGGSRPVPCTGLRCPVPAAASPPQFSSVFGETLTRLAGEDRHLRPDCRHGGRHGLTKFSDLPQPLFRCGHCRGHAVPRRAAWPSRALYRCWRCTPAFCSVAMICCCMMCPSGSMWCWG